MALLILRSTASCVTGIGTQIQEIVKEIFVPAQKGLQYIAATVQDIKQKCICIDMNNSSFLCLSPKGYESNL